MKTKRTKKAYMELYDNPYKLFGFSADDRGAQVILFPNGSREIWIKDQYGKKGFSIVASNGPAGFSVTVKSFVGTDDATLLATTLPDYECQNIDKVREVTLCQYNTDEKAQAFKAWYMADSTNKDEKEKLRLECKRLGVENF